MSSLRFALRSLARTPGFALLVVLCLSLGIGVNVAFLGVLDVLLVRPPAGVRAPESLYRITPQAPKDAQVMVGLQLSTADVARLRERRETFASVAGYTMARPLSFGSGAAAREVESAFVDGAYFGSVGVRPLVGRLLGDADAAAGAPRVVVLSERLWRSAHGGDAGVVGRAVRVNGHDVTVVGVVADRFSGTDASAAEAWLPTSAWHVAGGDRGDPEFRWLQAVARLAPGVTPERAQAVAATLLTDVDTPKFQTRRAGASVAPMTTRLGGVRDPERSPIPLWMLGATGVLLLVTCANVANLLLARGEWRRRELATRTALGATRAALVGQLLLESALLAAAGTLLGVWVASLGMRAFALLPTMPPLERVLDARVAVAAVAVAALATVLCGLAPALRGTRLDASRELRSGARTTASRSRLRGALMAGQLAAALALLVAGGVFLRSLRALQRVDVGFDLERAVVLSVNLEQAGIPEAERGAFAARVLERVRGLPQVAGAARVASAPFEGLMFAQMSVDGATLPSVGPPGYVLASMVSPGWDEASRVRLLAGRSFAEPDTKGDPVVMVSRAFARAAWRGGDALGQCVRDREGRCARVVGVVADVPVMDLLDTATALVYQPMDAAASWAGLDLYVRATDDAAVTARVVREAVQAMDERLPFVTVHPVTEGQRLRAALAPFRLASAAFTLFGGLALLVAAVGLYAVVAYAVARRTGEIGVRVALGATGAHVRRLVLGEGARHALVGVALGLAGGAAVTHLLRAKLYGVHPLDVPTFVVVTVVLVATALLASWLPARRAAAIPPTVALRSE